MMTGDNNLTNHKLIILYTLKQQEVMEGIELSDFMIFKGYMDYFSLQQYLDELVESGLLTKNASEYAITAAGTEVIDTFKSRIAHSIREEIDEYSKTSKLGRSSMLELTAEVSGKDGEGFTVECFVRDYDRVLLRFRIPADSESTAYRLRNNWLMKGMSLYRNLLLELRS